MASSFQRQALHRKLTYAGLIVVLFTVALVWRRESFRVFGYEVKGVDAQARELSIREQSRGEVDLATSVVRIVTMGLRGVATCWTMNNAMEAQKKNQWDQLELHVRTLVKLQPHFITPWIFQSWNLAYNVSVEADRINDRYFYIARGIDLLAEGERRNHDNPDMRWSIGFFTEHKIAQSDDSNALRSLSQLSMIPPNERDPARFWTVSEGGRQDVNLRELEDFCKDHPQLVRRLREGIRRERRSDQQRQFRCVNAEEFVRFLEENFRVPSLYVDVLPMSPGAWKPKQDKYKEVPTDRFPVLPPKHSQGPKQQPPDDSALTDEKQLLDDTDVYQVARAWYSYAQEPLPKPDKLPGHSEPIEDRVHQRLPRHMMTVIFRDQPAQAQRFSAERLAEEGWFDGSGWTVSSWFASAGDRFADGKPAVIGAGKAWGLEAWQRTLTMWDNFGHANHFLLSPAEQKTKEDQSLAFARKYNLNEGSSVPALRAEDLDAETREQLFAWTFMRDLNQYSRVCNFDYHYNRALVESRPDTVQCRKTFFEALDALRMHNDEPAALAKYQSPTGMIAWRDKVLLTNKVFRRDSLIQEYTYEIQLRYTDLYSRLHGDSFKVQSAGLLLVPVQTPRGAGACPASLALWMPPLLQSGWDNPLFGGPFDGNDEEGVPLVSEHARQTLLQRLFPATFKMQPAISPPEQPSATPPPS
jgi:hypothetical protein